MFVAPSETELLMLMSKYCKQGFPYSHRRAGTLGEAHHFSQCLVIRKGPLLTGL